MKKFSLFFFAIIVSVTAFPQQANLLSGRYDKEALKKLLIPQAKWTPFPRRQDRDGWAKADQGMMKAYLEQAVKYMDYEWPYIPATKSLLIERTGDRNEYQAISFKKRQVLGTLLLAEIYENKGRFVDQIIDGVWSICEESWWGVPAHLPKTKDISGLADVSQPFVELFSAETATYLAWVDYYLGDKLDAVSPQVRKRIYFETNKRIFQPLMTKAHGWMAANKDGRRPNNWNPWICSNWINATLLLEKDDNKRTDMIFKALNVLDQFLNPYPMDGGCDEGPGYWGAAAASLYDNVAMMNLATNNGFQYVYKDEKMANMGKFIYRAQIGKDYFLNFADADPRPKMAASMIYRYGKDIKDPAMMAFGAYYREPANGQLPQFQFFRNFYALFMQDEFASAEKSLPLPKDVWFPDLQVMIARDKEGSTDGFFVAAKGGNNDESHNHNDIGNYVVYYNGDPVLIDVGRGTYTRKTFSDQRYDIWYNCSDYHNLPTVNGQTQPAGANFKAGGVSYKKDKATAKFALDISKSYPASAGINSWQRTILLTRGKNVQVDDVFQLNTSEKVTEHLMTCYPAEIRKPGEMVIHYQPANAAAKDFTVHYNATQLKPSIEKVPLTAMEDKGIIEKWGDNIYRVSFEVVSPKARDKISFSIAPL